MSLNIGESSAVVSLLHFINPQSEDRPDPDEIKALLVTLRDKAAKALQVSGPAIISDAELDDAVDSLDLWIEYDQDYDADAAAEAVETVDTHGRT